MARSKHSTALFEVISRPRARTFSRPWGFLQRFTQRFSSRPDPQNPTPAFASTTASTDDPEQQLPPQPASGTDARRFARVNVDSDRYEITFKLTYSSAIICAFAIVTLIGAAFIAGRKMLLGPRPAFSANSTSQLQSQPPASDVLKLERKTIDVMPPDDADPQAAKATTSGAADDNPAAQPNTPRERTRTKGLNYVIIQSYPDQKMAGDAVKVLADNGIDCTIEKNVPGWAKWYVVMGLDGFDRLSNNPRYDAYIRKIREISDTYAKRGSFKAFAPAAFSWGKGS